MNIIRLVSLILQFRAVMILVPVNYTNKLTKVNTEQCSIVWKQN